MYDNSLAIQNNILTKEESLDDLRLDYKRPKETLAVIKVNISPGGLRKNIDNERVNPLYEWCKSKGIETGEIIALTKVFGKKAPARDSIHMHLEGSKVRKLSEDTIRNINREFKASGFKLFALKLINANGKNNLLLYLKNIELKNESQFLLCLRPIADYSAKTPQVQKHNLERELDKTFREKGLSLELAI